MNKVEQHEFENIVNKFSKIEDFRNAIWLKCRNLLNLGFDFEAFALILSTWNFARFRYVMNSIKSYDFEKLIIENEKLYKEIEDLKFRTVDFTNIELIRCISSVYNSYRGIKGIEQTGASKMMALRIPELFIMWDTKIRKFYKIRNKGTFEDYLFYLKKLQLKFNHLRWENKDKPFAKAIDEYNYYTVHQRSH